MSNYDQGQAPSGGEQPAQVFCPNCRGGNAPNAETCRWCGRPMGASSSAPTQQMPQGPGYTPYTQNPQQPPSGYAPQAQYPQQPPAGYNPQAQYPPQQPAGYAPQAQYPQQPQQPMAAPPANAQKRSTPIWVWFAGGVIALCLCAVGGTALFVNNVTDRVNEAITNNPEFFSTPSALEIATYTPVAEDFGGLDDIVVAEPTEDTSSLFDTLPADTPVTEEESSSETDTEGLGVFTEEGFAYLGAWMDWMQRYGNAFTEFGALNQDVQLTDEAWQESVAAQLAEIQAVDAEILDYQATSQFEPVHSKLQEAAQHYENMVDLYTEGIDEVDADLLTEAANELTTGATLMQEAVDRMSDMQP